MTRTRRLAKIIYVLARYRLDELVPTDKLPPWAKLLLMLLPWRFFSQCPYSRGERIRLALETLGPVFVKFGQILSTRRDLLPDDIAEELVKLQDNVPPFDPDQARAIIETNLGQPVEAIFARFDRQPLASASVAQVHTATLQNGDEVVIKVIRPGIAKTIAQDIALMFMLARAVERFVPDGHRLHAIEVVADYEQTIFDELDLAREAANASQLRRNFDQSELIYIPRVYWEYTGPKMLVMERIYGIPVADIDQLKAHEIDLRRLAERGVEIFFTQVFRDSFFHADMHAGNIFVNPEHPDNPQYIAVDFGIMGTLSPEDQSYLARNLLAFFNRDYRQIAQLYLDSGWIPPHTRVNEFESAIRTVCEPIFERPLKEISFGQFLLRLFRIARRYDMEVQPQLVLLQKTLLNIEGLGRQLYPDLDLWSTAHPFLERWMKERMAPPSMLKNIQHQLPEWIEQAPEIPRLVHDTLLHLKDTGAVQTSPAPTGRPSPSPPRRRRVLGALMLATGVFLTFPELQEIMAQLSMPAVLFFVAGLYLLLTPARSGR